MQTLNIDVPLKSIDSLILWLAGTNFDQIRFSVVQTPNYADFSSLKFYGDSQRSKLFGHDCNWEGVTFPVGVKNLFVCAMSNGNPTTLLDNRGTDNIVHKFNPENPISLEDYYVKLTWDVDDSVYKFAQSEQIRDLLSVVHNYTMSR